MIYLFGWWIITKKVTFINTTFKGVKTTHQYWQAYQKDH